jgi:hypothetical protein
MTTLAATKMAPTMTVTAAATARMVTSRTLLVVAELERTAQRSHRGYRLASHMARCDHFRTPSGDSTGRAPQLNRPLTTVNVTDLAFSIDESQPAQPPPAAGDTLSA